MKDLKRASEYFGISETVYKKTGAFDPVIGVDSLFFVDPLLLSKTKVPEFKDALAEVRSYFSDVITLLKVKRDPARMRAHKKLILREIHGVGIGYGSESDDGSGIGPKLAYRLLTTAEELLEMGVSNPAIFEIMGLFEEDFGPDRLSDGLIRILHSRIFAFSERLTDELKIKDTFLIKTYEKEYTVAKHPLKDGPLLFIPQNILRDIPVANSFNEISIIAAFNADLRKRFNAILAACFLGKKNLPKKSEIKRYLLETKDRIQTIVSAYESCAPEAYNFNEDPAGLYLWPEKAKELVASIPLVLPKKPKEGEVGAIVENIIRNFKKFMETKGGWRSLYNNKMEVLNESHARHFFYATALAYCEACDIDISPESNAGSGPISDPLFACRGKDVSATGRMTNEGFVVYKDSTATKDISKAVIERNQKVIEKLLSNNYLEKRKDGAYVFIKDYVFNSPSAASDIVLGNSTSGWKKWKTESGKTLEEIYRK